MSDGGRSPADIGARLITLREALGHTQGSFARLAGLSQSALANYESGVRRPELDKAFFIVNSTGITLDWLYLGLRQGLPQRLVELLVARDSKTEQSKRG